MSMRTLTRTAGLAALATVLAVASGSPSALPSERLPALFEAVAGLTLVGTGFVASRIPRLLRWNPLMGGTP